MDVESTKAKNNHEGRCQNF